LLVVDYRVTRDHYAAHAEPSLAVNPRNPLNLIGTAQFLTSGRDSARPGSFASFDGGRTWQDNGPLPFPAGYTFGDDVSATFTSRGTAFIAGEVCQRGGGSAVVVWRTTNGGRTFAAPLIVYRGSDPSSHTDHPWITAQAGARPYLYVAWSYSNRLLFSRSVDNGRSFAPAQTVSGPADSHPDWAVTTSGPGGVVHMVYYGGTAAPFEVVSSLDYSLHFGAPTAPSAPVAGGSGVQVSTLLGAATDPHSGVPYVACAIPSSANGHLQILVWRSADAGRTWSSPEPVTTGTSDHVQPQLAVDSSGEVDVTYFTLAHGRAREFLARSAANGTRYSQHRTIGSASFDPAKGILGKGGTGGKGGSSGWIGDYQGLAVGSRVVYPLWSDTRTGHLEIYVARVPVN
jgi:hypothetical protein